MNHIIRFNISELPRTFSANYGYCNKPMLHVDRTAGCEVLLFILSGCMPVVEDGVEYFLRAGDIFFLKKGIHHWGETPFAPDTSWYYIHFGHNEADDSIPELSPDFFHNPKCDYRISDYSRAITLPKHLHGLLKTNIKDKFEKVVELCNSSNPYLLAYINTCVHELLVDIYMLSKKSPPRDTPEGRFHILYNYLLKNTDKPFNPDEIEQLMGLSYKYIGEQFKQHSGITIHECFTKLKIEQACKLLSNSNMSISQISERLAYNDPLYFSNVFKKITGMSPRAYRNSYSSTL